MVRKYLLEEVEVVLFRLLQMVLTIELQLFQIQIRPFFGQIKGSVASYDFLKPYSESGDKTEFDDSKISFSKFDFLT